VRRGLPARGTGCSRRSRTASRGPCRRHCLLVRPLCCCYPCCYSCCCWWCCWFRPCDQLSCCHGHTQGGQAPQEPARAPHGRQSRGGRGWSSREHGPSSNSWRGTATLCFSITRLADLWAHLLLPHGCISVYLSLRPAVGPGGSSDATSVRNAGPPPFGFGLSSCGGPGALSSAPSLVQSSPPCTPPLLTFSRSLGASHPLLCSALHSPSHYTLSSAPHFVLPTRPSPPCLFPCPTPLPAEAWTGV